MSYAPVMSGGIIIEVPKGEYMELIATAERVAAVERLAKECKYLTANNILSVLNIKLEDGEDNAVQG